MAIKSILFIFSIILLFSCSSSKEKKNIPEVRTNRDSIAHLHKKETNIKNNQSINTISIKSKTIQRMVEGKMMNFTLNGNFKWGIKISENDGDKVILIDEVEPGIVHYRKTIIVKYPVNAHNTRETLNIIPDRFEFFDSNYNLINTFDIEKNNPFLQNVPSGIIIRNQYSDAETVAFLPKSKQTGKEKVKEYQLWTSITFQDGFSIVGYGIYMVSNSGWIIDNASYMIVLDRLGNKVFEHKYPAPISFPVMSLDGKYALFSIMQIETTSNSGVKTQSEGFEIWNTKKNKQIYSERNNDSNMWIGEPFFSKESNMLIIKYSYPNSKEIASKDYYFDLINKTLYSRIYTTSEYSDLTWHWRTKYKTYRNLINYFDFEKKILEDE